MRVKYWNWMVDVFSLVAHFWDAFNLFSALKKCPNVF